MLTDALVSAYRRSKWALVLRGLLGLALGIIILTRPFDSIAAFALVIAVWALVDGITQVVQAFEVRASASHWGLLLLSGIVSILFGAAAVYYYPGLSLAFAVVWASWWLLAGGAFAVYIAMQERKLQLSWGWTLTSGIISIAAAILAFVYPGITLAALMGLLAAFGIISGIAMLVAAGRMQSFENTIQRAARRPSHA